MYWTTCQAIMHFIILFKCSVDLSILSLSELDPPQSDGPGDTGWQTVVSLCVQILPCLLLI